MRYRILVRSSLRLAHVRSTSGISTESRSVHHEHVWQLNFPLRNCRFVIDFEAPKLSMQCQGLGVKRFRILGFDSILIIDSRYMLIQLIRLFNGQIHETTNYAYAFWQREDHKQVIAIPFWMKQSKMWKTRCIMSCGNIDKHWLHFWEFFTFLLIGPLVLRQIGRASCRERV